MQRNLLRELSICVLYDFNVLVLLLMKPNLSVLWLMMVVPETLQATACLLLIPKLGSERSIIYGLMSAVYYEISMSFAHAKGGIARV